MSLNTAPHLEDWAGLLLRRNHRKKVRVIRVNALGHVRQGQPFSAGSAGLRYITVTMSLKQELGDDKSSCAQRCRHWLPIESQSSQLVTSRFEIPNNGSSIANGN